MGIIIPTDLFLEGLKYSPTSRDKNPDQINSKNRMSIEDLFERTSGSCRFNRRDSVNKKLSEVSEVHKKLKDDLHDVGKVRYPLVTNSLLLHISIEIVNLPIKNGDFP